MASVAGTPGARARHAFERLARSGGRRTIARQLVLAALDESGAHRSAADLHARIVVQAPAVRLSTVYRTLSTLTEHGIVHTLVQGGETHYGFADAPHHHGVCSRCGVTTEIPAAAVAELFDRLRDIAGFTPAAEGITVTGLCRRCSPTERADGH